MTLESTPITFDGVSGGRQYLQVVQQVADRIAAGPYPAGHKLPPERDLAQQLGVGSGVVVLPEHLRDTTRGKLARTTDAGPYEVLKVRRLVEGLSAAQAATHARIDIPTDRVLDFTL